MTRGEVLDRIGQFAYELTSIKDDISTAAERGKNVTNTTILLALGDMSGQWDRFMHEIVNTGVTEE